MRKTLAITVSGKVQGVFFRQGTKEKALELGLEGEVSNREDGTVHIWVTGEEENLALLLDWCRTGPPRAQVDAVEGKETGLRHFEGFRVVS